jgi:hypothetical protein
LLAKRELVIPRTPFIVPYRMQGGTIQILRNRSLRGLDRADHRLAGTLVGLPLELDDLILAQLVMPQRPT